MNKRSYASRLAWVLAASLVLVSCGGNAGTPTLLPTLEPSPEPIPTQTAEPTPPPDVALAEYDGISLSVPPEECEGAYRGLIQSVTASDAQTVVFTLCRPATDFLLRLAWPTNAIYPREWIESTVENGVRTKDALQAPIGSGPYMVGAWQAGESITFTLNPDYWGESPATVDLIFRWLGDPASRLADLQAGIVDGIDSLPPEFFDPVRSDPLLVLFERAASEQFEADFLLFPAANGTAYRADVVNPQASPFGQEFFHLSAPGDRETFIWMQTREPLSLFCADEADADSLRACAQVAEPLYHFEVNGTTPIPALAESCESNEDGTIWTCRLRAEVRFHDGSLLDAEDVVATFNMGLNTASPFHAGNSNTWMFYDLLWGLMKRPGG